MSIHENTLKGLQELVEYAKGNLELRTTVVEVPDDEVNYDGLFKKLSANNRQKVLIYVNDLLLEEAG
ncbi:MAG: hypothetical protein FWD35_04155 [Oscillospiraceae bacterium]|nr:hypothetical protein [Oscillospiraceae bacterium]